MNTKAETKVVSINDATDKVRKEIDKLVNKINASRDQKERAVLQERLRKTYERCGMEVETLYAEPKTVHVVDGVETPVTADAGPEAELPKIDSLRVTANFLPGVGNYVMELLEEDEPAASEATEAAPAEATTGTEVKVEAPGFFGRIGAWIGEHKTALLTTLGGIIAVAGGVYAYRAYGNTETAVSSVHGSTDGSAEPEVTVETAEPAAGETIFTKIGGTIVSFGVYLKGLGVAAWNWITGLFSNKSTTEVVNEAPAEEAVPA